MVISDPRHTECSNLTEARSKMGVIYICNHENNVPSQSPPKCLCGNSWTWAYGVRLCACTSCAPISEFPQSYCGDNRKSTLFSRLHICYTHLASEKFECRESLKITYINKYILICSYINIYIYIYILSYRCVHEYIYYIYIYIIYTHTCRYIYTKNRIESLYIYNIYILI